jgi:hypothetical protein
MKSQTEDALKNDLSSWIVNSPPPPPKILSYNWKSETRSHLQKEQKKNRKLLLKNSEPVRFQLIGYNRLNA